MNIELNPCNECNQLPIKEIHGVSYIIICNPCNIKTKTAPIYLDEQVNNIHQEWNKINPIKQKETQ